MREETAQLNLRPDAPRLLLLLLLLLLLRKKLLLLLLRPELLLLKDLLQLHGLNLRPQPSRLGLGDSLLAFSHSRSRGRSFNGSSSGAGGAEALRQHTLRRRRLLKSRRNGMQRSLREWEFPSVPRNWRRRGRHLCH